MTRGNPLTLGHIRGVPLYLFANARLHHLFTCGMTGTGKSKFLESLLRQDLLAWPTSGCGLLLLDPHGSLYDSLINWLSWNDLKRPIITIDLRQDEWVIAYNLMRQRGASDPAAIVSDMVETFAHVWGKSNTQQTPRFRRWTSNILSILYECGFSLLEAEYLLDRIDERFRRYVERTSHNRGAVNDWKYINTASKLEFESQLESTINRFHPFLQTKVFRRTFGACDISLDLSKALAEGHIILACLATERNKVSPTDASLFGTLLLNDLWSAARERGKNEAEGPKPFYVYADECQSYLTPTLAKSLDQARGFGIGMTLACHFPRQFLSEGAHGQQLYDSIFVNARNKVVFGMDGRENLEPLAESLFMGTFDPAKIRHTLYSTKVMDYVEESRTISSRGQGSSESSATHVGSASGFGSGGTVGYNGPFDVFGNPVDSTDIDSMSLSSSEFESHSESSLSSYGSSESYSESEVPFQKPVMGQELSSIEYESISDQLHRSMAVLHDLEERHCVVKLMGVTQPVILPTPTVTRPPTPPALVKSYLDANYQTWDFALQGHAADAQIEAREKKVLGEITTPLPEHEPTTARRKLKHR